MDAPQKNQSGVGFSAIQRWIAILATRLANITKSRLIALLSWSWAQVRTAILPATTLLGVATIIAIPFSLWLTLLSKPGPPAALQVEMGSTALRFSDDGTEGGAAKPADKPELIRQALMVNLLADEFPDSPFLAPHVIAEAQKLIDDFFAARARVDIPLRLTITNPSNTYDTINRIECYFYHRNPEVNSPNELPAEPHHELTPSIRLEPAGTTVFEEVIRISPSPDAVVAFEFINACMLSAKSLSDAELQLEDFERGFRRSGHSTWADVARIMRERKLPVGMIIRASRVAGHPIEGMVEFKSPITWNELQASPVKAVENPTKRVVAIMQMFLDRSQIALFLCLAMLIVIGILKIRTSKAFVEFSVTLVVVVTLPLLGSQFETSLIKADVEVFSEFWAHLRNIILYASFLIWPAIFGLAAACIITNPGRRLCFLLFFFWGIYTAQDFLVDYFSPIVSPIYPFVLRLVTNFVGAIVLMLIIERGTKYIRTRYIVT